MITGLLRRGAGNAYVLSRLPLVRKEDLTRDPEQFVSTSWLGRRSVEFLTSGTTGQRGGGKVRLVVALRR